MDGLEEDLLRHILLFRSPDYELFKFAYTGNLDCFKRIALDHAEGEGIAVTEAIRKAKDKDGRGSLHHAAKGGSLQVCKYLLENLELQSLVDSKDAKGLTPLYCAIVEGHLDTVRYLLDKGANADASSDDNYTPLRCAAESGDTNIITLLLSRGARVDVTSRFGSALQEAALNGHIDAVKVLLDHNANPNLRNGQYTQHTPLFLAISAQSWECVELLLQAGADPNVASYGYTPLALSASYGCVDVIRRLLEAGADPNHKTNSGATALEIAASFGHDESVGVLFPVTSRIPTYPDWSIAGLMRHVNSDENDKQNKVYSRKKLHQAKSKGRNAFQKEKYLMALEWFIEGMTISPKDRVILSSISACHAHLGDGISALDYATKCVESAPEWPTAYYRLGVALNIQKRYDDAADAFNRGLTLAPRNKELKDAYMKAIEAGSNSIEVEEDNAE